MDKRKHIQSRTKVGLKFTAAERKLLEDLMCLDDNYVQIIRDTPADQPVQFTLDEWDDFGGYIAAEANHAKDKKLGEKLDNLFSKIQEILDTQTEEEPSATLRIHRGEDETAAPADAESRSSTVRSREVRCPDREQKPEGPRLNLTEDATKEVLMTLGKAQVDAMFRRQEEHAVDDSEFLPLVEVMINAFETADIDKAVAEEVWEYAFEVYDRACKEAEPSSTTAENRKLMQRYLLGSRGLKQKPRR